MKQILLFVTMMLQLAFASIAAENKPIEITSDTLKYYPKERKAIFEGGVEAIQGEMKIHCHKMIVNLRDDGKAETKEKAQIDLSSGKIKNIEVYGNVIVNTPKEKAEADRGEYDLNSGLITLYENVKLYQGANQLFGDKLIFDKVTGESVVSSENKSKRVKGLFISGDKNESK